MPEVVVVAVFKVGPGAEAEVASSFGILSEPPLVMFCEPVPAGDPAKGAL